MGICVGAGVCARAVDSVRSPGEGTLDSSCAVTWAGPYVAEIIGGL
jgi:hypothetical protein